jgi:hypothetical protein
MVTFTAGIKPRRSISVSRCSRRFATSTPSRTTATRTGEHDFGAIDDGGVRCFWKIGCYDRATEIGRPIPPLPPSPCAC